MRLPLFSFMDLLGTRLLLAKLFSRNDAILKEVVSVSRSDGSYLTPLHLGGNGAGFAYLCPSCAVKCLKLLHSLFPGSEITLFHFPISTG